MDVMDALAEKIRDNIKEWTRADKYGGIRVYVDYDERYLSPKTIGELISQDDPREAFEMMLDDMSIEYGFSDGYADVEQDVRINLTEEEDKLYMDNQEEMREFLQREVYFSYDENDFNAEVNVNIMIDCGNWNRDCTCDNVLNWYGRYGYGEIDELSSVLWLAKTQGKAEKLKEACKRVFRPDGNYLEREIQKDRFIESCVQELENLPSGTATVTFLVKMPLLDLLNLAALQNRENGHSELTDPRENTEPGTYIVLGKETMCGLYDPFSGGGSVFEIELDRDVNLPIKYAKINVEGASIYGRYDVNDVYGLVDSAWADTVKEVGREMDTAA